MSKGLLQGLSRQSTFMRVSDHHQYSNLAMALLGEVVASASGTSYEEYVQRQILEPLKLADTRPFMPMALYGKRLAQGHGAIKREGTRELLKPFDTRGMAAAAGFTSTVEDLARFAVWQFRLRKAGGSELLRVATLRDMQRVQWTDDDGKNTWGLGFAVRRDGANTVVSHNGVCPGYLASIALALKDEVTALRRRLNRTPALPQRASSACTAAASRSRTAASNAMREAVRAAGIAPSAPVLRRWSSIRRAARAGSLKRSAA